jgi:hypothetical protein
MNEQQFAQEIRRSLDESAARLPYRVSHRLELARNAALARQSTTEVQRVNVPVGALAGAGASSGSPEHTVWWRLAVTLVPVLVVAVGLMVISVWNDTETADEIAEVDTAVLTDEVPLSAYTDRGLAFSKTAGSEPRPPAAFALRRARFGPCGGAHAGGCSGPADLNKRCGPGTDRRRRGRLAAGAGQPRGADRRLSARNPRTAQPSWNSLPLAKRWLALTEKMPGMSPAERAKAQVRIREWASLSPEQRRMARNNYRLAKSLDRDERVATWESYRQMTPEQRSVLRANGWTSNTAARHAGSPTGLAKEAARPIAVVPAATRPAPGSSNPRTTVRNATVAPPLPSAD